MFRIPYAQVSLMADHFTFERLITYRVFKHGEHYGWIHRWDSKGWYFLPKDQKCPIESTAFYLTEDLCRAAMRKNDE